MDVPLWFRERQLRSVRGIPFAIERGVRDVYLEEVLVPRRAGSSEQVCARVSVFSFEPRVGSRVQHSDPFTDLRPC